MRTLRARFSAVAVVRARLMRGGALPDPLRVALADPSVYGFVAFAPRSRSARACVPASVARTPQRPAADAEQLTRSPPPARGARARAPCGGPARGGCGGGRGGPP